MPRRSFFEKKPSFDDIAEHSKVGVVDHAMRRDCRIEEAKRAVSEYQGRMFEFAQVVEQTGRS